MTSTIASTLVCVPCLQEIGTSAGDVSYELNSYRSLNDSLSAGSAVSADSFVGYYCDDFDEPDDLVDPYLTSNRRWQQRLKKNAVSPVRTLVTAMMDYEDDDDTITQIDNDDNIDLTESHSLKRGLPTFLESPIRSFETIKCNEEELLRQREEISPMRRKNIHERCYWNKIVSDRIKHYGGAVNLRVAEGLMLLGNAHANCEEYIDALKIFRSAVRIFRKIHGDDHLTVARSLDKAGLVCSKIHDCEHLKMALIALSEAFSIRFEALGPIHVDTVDTLNNMAAVYWHRREYEKAREAYLEVYAVRQVIFGPTHPAVAVTAHSLGSVFLNLGQIQSAKRYFCQSLEIYKQMKLTREHTTLQRLIRDMVALERISGSAEMKKK